MWTPADGSSGTLVIELGSLEDALETFDQVWRTGIADADSHYGFASYEDLHRILAPNRMAILRVMMGAGPLTIREIARRIQRDFKGVHTDVTSLHRRGLILHTTDGKMIFPYERIRFAFKLPLAEHATT